MISNPILFIGLAVVLSIMTLMVFDIISKKFKESKTKKEENKTKVAETTKKNDGELKVRKTPTTSYSDLLDVLNKTIEKELYFAVKLKFNFQDVKIIDFNKNLESISAHIMDALSQSYLEDLSYYHNKKWIMEYIVRTVSIYLTDYIKKHPIS